MCRWSWGWASRCTESERTAILSGWPHTALLRLCSSCFHGSWFWPTVYLSAKGEENSHRHLLFLSAQHFTLRLTHPSLWPLRWAGDPGWATHSTSVSLPLVTGKGSGRPSSIHQWPSELNERSFYSDTETFLSVPRAVENPVPQREGERDLHWSKAQG